MDGSLFEQGLTLMLVGMGTVFVFLTALVGAMSALSAVAQRLLPASDEAVTPEEVAAISAAIARHRQNR